MGGELQEGRLAAEQRRHLPDSRHRQPLPRLGQATRAGRRVGTRTLAGGLNSPVRGPAQVDAADYMCRSSPTMCWCTSTTTAQCTPATPRHRSPSALVTECTWEWTAPFHRDTGASERGPERSNRGYTNGASDAKGRRHKSVIAEAWYGPTHFVVVVVAGHGTPTKRCSPGPATQEPHHPR